VAFTPDGRTLATGSTDTTVILWDFTDPARPRQLGPSLTGHTDSGRTGRVDSVAFAPDGRTLATASAGDTVILWDLTDPARPRQLGPPLLTSHTGPVNSVAFAPDGRTLATGSDDTTVILWDLTDPARPRQLGPPLTGHNGSVDSVVFVPDGRTLATGSADNTVILWDLTGLNHLLSHAVERACSITRGGLDRDEWTRRIPDLPYQDSCPCTAPEPRACG
jgi:WD40 repeat protein